MQAVFQRIKAIHAKENVFIAIDTIAGMVKSYVAWLEMRKWWLRVFKIYAWTNGY
jgi:hypothetical protein